MSAQFFGRSGKFLYGAFSIVGMASQSHNVNKGIPDDRVARSRGGRSREHFGGYKTINRIPLPLPLCSYM